MSQNSRRRSNSNSNSSGIHSNSTLSESAIFSQRIVAVDCYTSYPIPKLDPLISQFRGTEVKRVPVIRIYGATPRGQKTCTHVHGVFPYIYIEHNSTDEDSEDFEYLLAVALDNGINSAFNYSKTKPSEHVNYQHQHVFNIRKVLGKSLYGYKSAISRFLQIYFYSPVSLKKGVELLESGNILGECFQPFEAHIPYILQFFLDFKLYGMNFIHFSEIKFRQKQSGQNPSRDLSAKSSIASGQGSRTCWDLETIQEDLLLPLRVLPKSRVELEIDVKASDILVSDSTQGKNPGIVDIWLDEKERRRQHTPNNWADITIPQSPERSNETDFIFGREAELLQMLGNYLSGATKSSEMAELSQRSLSIGADLSQLQQEASFMLDLTLPALDKTYSATSLQVKSRRNTNESDDDIINLLEDVDIDKEENDSILQCSQVSTSLYPENVATTNTCHNEEVDEDYLMEEAWAKDFLSPSTIDLLEKWEEDRMNRSDEKDSVEPERIQDHIQCDGQFDDSDSDDDDDVDIERLKRRKLNTSIGVKSHLPSNLGRRKQTLKTLSLKSIYDNKAADELGSDSDSDCQIISVVKSPNQQKSISIITSQQKAKTKLESIIMDLRKVNSVKTGKSKESVQPVPSALKQVADEGCIIDVDKSQNPIQSNTNEQNQSFSQSSETKSSSDDNDSGITSFYDITHLPEEIEISSDSSQEILPASPEKVNKPVATVRTKSKHCPLPPTPQDFVTSIYEYGDEDETSLNDEEESPSQPESINSFYEYSPSNDAPGSTKPKSPEVNSGATFDSPNTSFLDIVVDFSAPPGNLRDSDSDQSQSEQEDSSQPLQSQSKDRVCPIISQKLSEFQSKKIKHQTSRRIRREQTLASRDRLRPSIFGFEIHPLKQAPLNSDIEKWCIENEKTTSGNRAKPEPEPLSLNYLRDTATARQSKNKLVLDILRFSRTIAKNQEKLKMGLLEDDLTQTEADNSLKKLADLTENIGIDRSSSAAESRNELIVSNDQIRKQNQREDNSSSDDSDDEIPKKVKAFRFLGAGEESASGSSDSENEAESLSQSQSQSQISQAISPMISSQGSDASSTKTITPRSILTNTKGQKRHSTKKRLEFDLNTKDEIVKNGASFNLGLVPNFHPDDSELDSLSVLNGSDTMKLNRELNSSNLKHAKASHEHQFLTTLALEVHCSARDHLVPDPEHDSINAIFYVIHNDCPADDDSFVDSLQTGMFLVDPSKCLSNSHTNTDQEELFMDEISMLQRFIYFVHACDPDLLVGYEIERFSWGYLIQRGMKLGINMTSELSRLLPLPYLEKKSPFQDQWNESINGRIVFNLWKLLRHEVTVTSYTFESMSLQILHEKVHRLSYRILDNYWKSEEKRANVINYFKTRVLYSMRIIDKLDLINRTSELARLFGIQFFEVLSRGSQFRVESMMLRLAKPEILIPPSPNPNQRAKMKAPEYLPLILEPESSFYTEPVAVLDFQSLYPSMMIAYNYCFSTCIGRLQHLGEDSFELGCLSQTINKAELAQLYKDGLVHISPCGVAFVKASVRKGILSTMLEQILDTRQMVKRSMKKWKNNETLQKVLDSRQLGLKLIANVTYGYTSANWSGRMPCVEIADSIVSKGRETLQRAIEYVKENEHIFGGKVVYGDTDSLFVHFPGKTKQEAFRLAQKIVDDVTQLNPKPVKLKLEKIYQPCILQTKKRYVGYAYETPDQKEPKYDAKGIETVRRDGCPATAKILEGALRVLFTKRDEDSVKQYVTEQFRKIFLGRVSLSKYTFARQFRGRSGYKPGARVPSLEIAKKLGEKDKRAEPLPKERVPYIVTYGDPLAPLIQRIRRPEEFLNDPNLRLNSHYYIEKAIIPALNRCLNLAGFHADKWLSEMPRKYLKSDYIEGQHKKGTIDQYFKSQKCIKCESRAVNGFCQSCFKTPKELKEFLTKQSGAISSKHESCLRTCQDCSKENEMICINMDCPVKHRYLRYSRDFQAKIPKIKELQNRLAVLDW